MSYTAKEKSDYSGHPLELYRFSMGALQWLYTSGDHVVAYGEDEYQPVYIKRGGFTKGGDARKSTMQIEVAASNDVTRDFRSGWLPSIMIITIYRHHYEDNEFSVLWKGRITGCKWSGSLAKLTSDSVFTLFQRAGLRRSYQIGCPHVLFGAACGLTEADFQTTGTVSATAERQVTVNGIGLASAGYYVGGMLQHGDELRMITAHSGDVVTLVDPITDCIAGETVTLWPGCAHTMNACLNKFNNLDNYGGLPFLPKKNPFSGDALV
jgi:uncharacterized phage protein (TIGR02218 family)